MSAATTQDGFRRECECVLWGSNGQLVRHANPVHLLGLVEGSQPCGRQRRYITQKPVDVLRQLAQNCPPVGTVLEPCVGAGSAGVAAIAEGRSFVGVEITVHYSDIANQRLRETTERPNRQARS